MNRFAQLAKQHLFMAGVTDAKLIESSYSEESFGNSHALFQVEPFLIRFIRDRGQEFVDMAFASHPDIFFHFDDVAIAMGWVTVGEIMSRRSPEPVQRVVDQLGRNLRSLQDFFSDAGRSSALARLEDAAKERGQAFMARLDKLRTHPRRE